MTSDHDQVIEATRRFYDAIEQMVSGKGLAAMEDAWHHIDEVTSGHPSGGWAHGWDEVWATWQVFAGFGAPDRGGSSISELRASVFGDAAYATCMFRASKAHGGDSIKCTNVLVRIDGKWKIVHHHADPSRALAEALTKLVGG
ncbi:MAG: nuclear transport factor 2 family protein [Polyangiaceae bacterium]|nr:nuclear transport factor 2 family protein [Polyangiaceae bacterium]